MNLLIKISILLLSVSTITVLGHRRGGKNINNVPNFLKGLQQNKITEYYEIFNNELLTKRQFRSAIEQFVLNLPENNKNLYKEWKNKHENKHREFSEKFNEKISKLSNDAQELAKKIKNIHDNLDLTKKQEREQIQKLKQNVPDEIRKEVKAVFPGHHGHKNGQRKISKNPNQF